MDQQRRKLDVMMLLLAGCDWFGSSVARVIPALEVINPELAAEPVDCDPPIPTPSPGHTGVIGTLACGDVVEGNTSVGNSVWNDQFYVHAAYCTPAVHYYDQAPEVIYRIEVPPNHEATVQLDSNCVDLDVSMVAWQDTTSVPHDKHSIAECQMDDSTGGGTVRGTAVDKPYTYLVGVDGKKGAIGNYRLTVTCRIYR